MRVRHTHALGRASQHPIDNLVDCYEKLVIAVALRRALRSVRAFGHFAPAADRPIDCVANIKVTQVVHSARSRRQTLTYALHIYYIDMYIYAFMNVKCTHEIRTCDNLNENDCLDGFVAVLERSRATDFGTDEVRCRKGRLAEHRAEVMEHHRIADTTWV